MDCLVKLHYLFRHFAPKGEYKKAFVLAIREGATVRELMQALNMPDGEEEKKLIFLNGVRADETAIIHSGDTVAIYPPIVGG